MTEPRCPKCGKPVSLESRECPACGLIFSKFIPKSAPTEEPAKPATPSLTPSVPATKAEAQPRATGIVEPPPPRWWEEATVFYVVPMTLILILIIAAAVTLIRGRPLELYGSANWVVPVILSLGFGAVLREMRRIRAALGRRDSGQP